MKNDGAPTLAGEPKRRDRDAPQNGNRLCPLFAERNGRV